MNEKKTVCEIFNMGASIVQKDDMYYLTTYFKTVKQTVTGEDPDEIMLEIMDK